MLMEGIDIQIDHIGALKDIALFRVNGYVDTTTSPELQKTLTQSIEAGLIHYIIDLSSVHYVSSAGWGVFVGEIRNLRENGGDLKIVQMTPEVIEVFEMLEFNRILSNYDSLEEAVDDYDFSRGLDLKNILFENSGSSAEDNVVWVATKEKQPQQLIAEKDEQLSPAVRIGQTKGMADANLPLTEKIKKIVLENPRPGTIGIKRMLFSPRFGYTKVSFLKLRSILKKMGLDSKNKRFRYFRSR
jgi:anti-anti-sigma factor